MDKMLAVLKENQENQVPDVVGVLLDAYKAYDQVNLDRLYDMIYEDDQLDSFLKNDCLRAVEVMWNTEVYIGKGEICRKTKGIPQGSALSPILFAYYQHRLLEGFLSSSGIELFAFADNLSFICKESEIEANIRSIEDALAKGGLKLNRDETKIFSLRPLTKSPCTGITVQKFRHLGYQLEVYSGILRIQEDKVAVNMLNPWRNPALTFYPHYVRLHYTRAYVNSRWTYQLLLFTLMMDKGDPTLFRGQIRQTVAAAIGLRNLNYLDLILLRLDPVYLALKSIGREWLRAEDEVQRSEIRDRTVKMLENFARTKTGMAMTNFDDVIKFAKLADPRDARREAIESIWRKVFISAARHRTSDPEGLWLIKKLIKYKSFWLRHLNKDWLTWKTTEAGSKEWILHRILNGNPLKPFEVLPEKLPFKNRTFSVKRDLSFQEFIDANENREWQKIARIKMFFRHCDLLLAAAEKTDKWEEVKDFFDRHVSNAEFWEEAALTKFQIDVPPEEARMLT